MSGADDSEQRSESLFETLAEGAPVGMYRIDHGVCTYVNARFCELTGQSGDAATKNGWMATVHPADLRRAREEWSEAARTGRPFGAEYRFQRPDGTIVWLRSEARPDAGARGLGSYVGTLTDVTALKRAEQELRQTRDRLDATLEALPDLLFEVDESGRIFDYHAQQVELLAVPPEQFLGKTFHEVLPQSAADACVRAIRQAAQHGHSLGPRYRLQMPFGERWFEPSVARKSWAGGERPRFILLARDITERLNAEKTSAEQARLLELIFEHSLDDMVILDKDYNFVRVSDSYARACQMNAVDLLGRNHFEVFPSPFEAEIAPYRRSKQTYRRAERPFLFPEHPERGTTYWDLAMVPILDATGEIEFYLFTLKDVTARKRAEDFVATSLREKETLLREIHHRVKNNLQVIASLLFFQARRLGSAEGRAQFEELRERLFAISLVHELLYQSSNVACVDFGSYVRALVGELAGALVARRGSRIKLDLEVEPMSLPIELAMPSGMIVCELFTNIMKYAFPDERAGTAAVRVSQAETSILLEVQDDGIGLPRDFDAATAGSFGWELVRMLVRQLRGSVEVRSEQGTYVRVSFPRTEAEVAAPV